MKSKVILALIITLLIIYGSFMLLSSRSNNLSPDTKVVTGLSVVFQKSLVSTAKLRIQNDKGEEIKQTILAEGGKRYNLDLKPGVYTLKFEFTDRSLPPLSENTVTITEGNLTSVELNFSYSSESMEM